MEEFGLTKFLDTPTQIFWQEDQSAKSTGVGQWNYQNDAWSQDISDENFYYGINYADYEYSDAYLHNLLIKS